MMWLLLVGSFVVISSATEENILVKVNQILNATENRYDKDWLVEQQTAMEALNNQSSLEVNSANLENKTQIEHVLKEIEKIATNEDDLSEPDITSLNKAVANFTYEGDIILSPQQIYERINLKNTREKRASVPYEEYLWDPDVQIQFSIGGQLNAAVIRSAIELLRQKTCLKFKEVKTVTGNGLRYMKGQGCYSNLGKSLDGKPQDVSIGQGCGTVGVVVHETMHALGFLHTQSRSDRDDFVKINTENIRPGAQGQFSKSTGAINSDVNYDYGSVMHYKPYEFSVDNQKPTVVPLKPHFLYTLGSRIEPAFSDLMEINNLYKCAEKCPNPVNCANGGIINPKTCNTCICPKYFWGNLCKNRVVGNAGLCTGKVRTWAKSANFTVQLNAGKGPKQKTNDITMNCPDSIQCPEGSKVEFKILNVEAACVRRCLTNGFEINLGDPRYTGFKVCCNNLANQLFTSESNILNIYGYTKTQGKPTMKYQARCV